ncbi:MAG: SDR family NAD(P)-dependent oxidoreductase, partial [Rhodospirillales bacterium]|nr:SDR family NAD(P)-dependent oxidoreductase [Rhodospirillales bacterium]
MQKIATVFGGAGFIGRYVVQRLARQDWQIRIATHDPAGARVVQTSGRVGQIVALRADVTDEAGAARAVEGASLVINLVGVLHGGRGNASFAAGHLALAKKLVAA